MLGYRREWIADCHHDSGTPPDDGGLWAEAGDPVDCNRGVRGGFWETDSGSGSLHRTGRNIR
jgi:hypothetical protein